VRRRIATEVLCGDGARMLIVGPRAAGDEGAEWLMRYGNVEPIRLTVAELIASYDHLCSDEITMAEAIRRLRLMRAARKALANG
jgi:hypothetical protein